MTEEQIIKGLNDTVGKEHIGIYCTDKNGNFTTVIKLTDIVDFINRQKSTIDELTKAYKSLKSEKNAEIEQKDVVIKGLEKALENVTIEADRLLKECESKEKAYTDEYILRKELKAEIERLQGINERLESAFVAECNLSACSRKKEIRDEAIKEFAKKYEKAVLPLLTSATLEKKDGIYACLDILKEMVGDE